MSIDEQRPVWAKVMVEFTIKYDPRRYDATAEGAQMAMAAGLDRMIDPCETRHCKLEDDHWRVVSARLLNQGATWPPGGNPPTFHGIDVHVDAREDALAANGGRPEMSIDNRTMTTEEAYRAGYKDAMHDAKRVLAMWDEHEPRIVQDRLAIHEIVLSRPTDTQFMRDQLHERGYRLTIQAASYGGLDAIVRDDRGAHRLGLHYFNGPDTNEDEVVCMIYNALTPAPKGLR